MAYSTALEEEEEAGWQCCMPPRGSFGVLSPSQGAAEGVRSRDNPPPQPRPVEAHLSAAMRSPLGAPGGRSKVGRAPMGGGGWSYLLHTERHRSGPVHSPRGGLHKVCAAGARRQDQVQCHARTRRGHNGEPSFPSHSVPQRKRPLSYWNWPTSDLPRASLFEPESYFLLGPVGTLLYSQTAGKAVTQRGRAALMGCLRA